MDLLALMDFLTLAASCGPTVHPVTTAAIVKTESAYNALVIRDNSLGITFKPTDLSTAQVIVEEQTRAGHALAIGLMQVTTPWVTKLKLRASDLLDSCTNIHVGTSILAANYRLCAVPGRSPQSALECALSMYWSGSGQLGGAYVNQVYRLAGSLERVPETPGVTDGLLGSSVGFRGRIVPAITRFRYRAQTFSFPDPP
jgi:type IV secretion system protein VirB1